MTHLAHRDERASDISVRFYARPACGQRRGFHAEADDCECVHISRVSEVDCRRCLRIYNHYVKHSDFVTTDVENWLALKG